MPAGAALALQFVAGTLIFQGLDQIRRCIGTGLDLVSPTPLEAPCCVLCERHGMRLRQYLPGAGDGPAPLIVPAPIKRHWTWDSAPELSVVQHALQRGHAGHLLEWTPAPASWSLAEAVAAIGSCVDEIEQRTRRLSHLLGHSLGGTLHALHAALRPGRPASLVLVEAPLRFRPDAGAFAPLLACSPPRAVAADLCVAGDT